MVEYFYKKNNFNKNLSTFCEKNSSFLLSDLSTENVIEGVVRFLWACDPNIQNLISTYKLSIHTTNRFKMATNLSIAIKVLILEFYQ